MKKKKPFYIFNESEEEILRKYYQNKKEIEGIVIKASHCLMHQYKENDIPAIKKLFITRATEGIQFIKESIQREEQPISADYKKTIMDELKRQEQLVEKISKILIPLNKKEDITQLMFNLIKDKLHYAKLIADIIMEKELKQEVSWVKDGIFLN